MQLFGEGILSIIIKSFTMGLVIRDGIVDKL